MLRRFSIALVLLLLLLPALFGQVLVQQFYRVDTKIQQQSPLKLTDASHSAGWQHSQIKRRYRLPDKNQIQTQHDINYNYFPLQAIQIQTQILPDPNLSNIISNHLNLKTNPAFKIQTQIHSPQHLQGQFQLQNQPAALQGHFSYQAQQLNLEQQINSLQIQGISLSKIQQTLNWKTPKLQTQINIKQLNSDPQNPIWRDSQIQQLQAHIQLAQNGAQLWDSAIQLNSEQIQQNHIKLGKLQLDLAAWRLHQGSLKQLLTLAKAPPLQRKLMMPLFLLQHAPTFLRHAPKLQIKNLQLNSANSQLKLSALLQTAQNPSSKPFNLFDFFQNLQIKIDLELTGDWLTWIENPNQVSQAPAIYQISQFLRELKLQKWLKIKQDRAQLHVGFDGGRWYKQ